MTGFLCKSSVGGISKHEKLGNSEFNWFYIESCRWQQAFPCGYIAVALPVWTERSFFLYIPNLAEGAEGEKDVRQLINGCIINRSLGSASWRNGLGRRALQGQPQG